MVDIFYFLIEFHGELLRSRASGEAAFFQLIFLLVLVG